MARWEPIAVTLHVREQDTLEQLSPLVLATFLAQWHPTKSDTIVLKPQGDITVPIEKASGMAELVRTVGRDVQVTPLGPVLEGMDLSLWEKGSHDD